MAGGSVLAATLLLTTLVHWARAQGCGSTNAVLASNQVYTLTSINFPYPYPATTSYYCTFTGTAPADHKVFLQCDSFDVVYSPQCNLAWFVFSASGDAQFTDGIRYCGYYQTLSLQTTGNKFAAAFVNDYFFENNPYTGYRCYVVAIPNTSATTTPTPTTKASTTPATTTKAPTTPAPSTPSTTKAPTTPPSTCTCGIKNSGSRIVGGQATTVHEYPWMVALVGTTTGTPFCGGALIDNQWVLTATHCLAGFQASDIIIRLGEHQVGSTTETSQTISRNVAQIIVHENYNDVTVDNDIGLVKLSSPVIYSNQINPACLPLRFPTAQDFHGKNATVTGWGTTAYQGFVSDILQEITMPVFGRSQCNNTFPSVAGKLTANMFCTYAAGKDSCQGDSGGPLVYEEAGRNYLIGVVSWGIKCAENGNPGVYAKVNNYLDWIKQKTGATFCNV